MFVVTASCYKRAGSTLALAEVLVALADVDYELAPDAQAKVGSPVLKLEELVMA